MIEVSPALDGMKCRALVLTDPSDLNSPMARCCNYPAVWTISQAGAYRGPEAGPVRRRLLTACRRHTNIVLVEIEYGREQRSPRSG